MSEQRVMTTPIFDELVNELGSLRKQEDEAAQPKQDDHQQDEDH